MLIENQVEQSQTEADTIYFFENKLVLSLFDPDRRQQMMDIRIQVNQARGQFNFRWALPCPPSISATLRLSWLLPSSSYLLTKATTILRYFCSFFNKKLKLCLAIIS